MALQRSLILFKYLDDNDSQLARLKNACKQLIVENLLPNLLKSFVLTMVNEDVILGYSQHQWVWVAMARRLYIGSQWREGLKNNWFKMDKYFLLECS